MNTFNIADKYVTFTSTERPMNSIDCIMSRSQMASSYLHLISAANKIDWLFIMLAHFRYKIGWLLVIKGLLQLQAKYIAGLQIIN